MTVELEQLVERYLAGEMSEEERVRFESRAVEDAELANLLYQDTQLRSMIETAAAERMRQQKARQTAPETWLPRWLRLPALRWTVPATAAAAILLVLLYPHSPDEEPKPVFRGGGRTIRGIAPNGIVDRLPARFIWSSSPEAVRYRFELFDSLSTSVYTIVTVDTSVAVDATVAVPRLGHWSVTPLGPSSRSTSSETVVSYRVSR